MQRASDLEGVAITCSEVAPAYRTALMSRGSQVKLKYWSGVR